MTLVAVAAALLLAGPAFAQLTAEGSGDTEDPFGGTSTTSTDLDMLSTEQPQAAGCPHAHAVRRTRTVSFTGADGPITLLEGEDKGHDGWITLESVQNGPVRMELQKTDGSTETRSTGVGKVEVNEFTFTKKTDLFCEDPTGAPCIVATDIIYVANNPQSGHQPDDMGLWIQIPGFGGDVADKPDDFGLCLWDGFDTLFSSQNPRKIDLFIELTGNQDLNYEIIDVSDTVAWSGTLQAGALPQFQSLIGVFEDVKEIRYSGSESPVSPGCSDATFHYEIKFVN